MRRREEIRVATEELPEPLRSMAGVRTFLDDRETPPAWQADTATYRYLVAFRRWIAARRRWCASQGLDYAATFHPEWRRPS